jgi:hypothetical protein
MVKSWTYLPEGKIAGRPVAVDSVAVAAGLMLVHSVFEKIVQNQPATIAGGSHHPSSPQRDVRAKLASLLFWILKFESATSGSRPKQTSISSICCLCALRRRLCAVTTALMPALLPSACFALEIASVILRPHQLSSNIKIFKMLSLKLLSFHPYLYAINGFCIHALPVFKSLRLMMAVAAFALAIGNAKAQTFQDFAAQQRWQFQNLQSQLQQMQNDMQWRQQQFCQPNYGQEIGENIAAAIRAARERAAARQQEEAAAEAELTREAKLRRLAHPAKPKHWDAKHYQSDWAARFPNQ